MRYLRVDGAPNEVKYDRLGGDQRIAGERIDRVHPLVAHGHGLHEASASLGVKFGERQTVRQCVRIIAEAALLRRLLRRRGKADRSALKAVGTDLGAVAQRLVQMLANLRVRVCGCATDCQGA